MNRTSRLGLAGIGACVLGVVMTLGAAAGLYPHPNGSNLNLDANILFAIVFFTGELIGLLGLGVLIYLAVYRRQRGKTNGPFLNRLNREPLTPTLPTPQNRLFEPKAAGHRNRLVR